VTPGLTNGILLWFLGIVFVGALFIGLAADPKARPGGDWDDYRTASLRLLDGRSPYAAEMLRGPVAAQGPDRYRYPPPFAQLLTPVAVLPAAAGELAWSVIQATVLFLAVWISATAAGAPATMERFVWTGVALTFFLPVFAMIWTGNAEAPQALAVATLLAAGEGSPVRNAWGWAAGLVTGVAVVFKLTPVAMMPAVILRRGSVAAAALIAIGVIVIPSLLSAPEAWGDYLRVFPNLLAGDARYPNNLAPAIVALNLGAPDWMTDLVRVLALATAALLVAASIVLARRIGAWPAAVGCAVIAALLVPAALWYHYLTVLLPLATFAWVRAGRPLRGSIVASAAVVSLGLALPAVAAVAGAWLSVSAIAGVWPRLLGRPAQMGLGTHA
jgi:Glycosyltransferase family 87